METVNNADIFLKLDCTRFSFIDDEAIWLKMLNDRNNALHMYKQEDAMGIFKNIALYLPVFEKTYAALKKKYNL